MALLIYVLLRFQAWRNHWAHSFSRLLTLCRAALWLPRDLGDLLARYGTCLLYTSRQLGKSVVSETKPNY